MNKETITISEATEKGYKRYFTGKPCFQGHIEERYVVSRQCIECQRLRTLKYSQKEETKEKARNARLQKCYGVTLEKLNNATVCEICSVALVIGGTGPDSVCVDHDHVTNKTRGFLCNHCNRALGLFKDDSDIVAKAKAYLDKYADKEIPKEWLNGS